MCCVEVLMLGWVVISAGDGNRKKLNFLRTRPGAGTAPALSKGPIDFKFDPIEIPRPGYAGCSQVF